MSRVFEHCPLCEATTVEPLFVARDPHYEIPGSHQVCRCTTCTLVFLNPMYSDEELASLYPKNYYAYNEEIKAGPWKKRAKKLLGYWQGTKEPHFDKPGVFLDLGCGAGDFVQRMRDAGWDSYGVEVNQDAARRAKTKGLKVFAGSLQEAQFAPESFDYIRASHSLEHITCPHETLDEIHRLLKPNGKLLIAVPNIDGFSARLFRQYWYHLCAPIHAFNYSVETVERILSAHKFQVTDLIFNSHYAGILGSAQIWLNRKNGGSSQGLLFENRGLRVLSGWVENFCDFVRLGDMIEIVSNKTS